MNSQEARRGTAALLMSLLPMAAGQGDDPPKYEGRVTVPAEEAMAEEKEQGAGVRTLGGRQFWGDIHFFRGWRIQQNVFSGQFRLLDVKDRRHASGTLEHCRQRLDEIRKADQLPRMSGRAVILIHGIIRSSKSMRLLAQRLEQSGVTVVPFDYPSTQVPLAESAGYLRQVLASLEGIETIDLVVHSMGGLVVRESLKPEHGPQDPRLRRMVMMGVPNRGARMANLLQHNPLFQLVFGPAGQQLVEDAAGLPGCLPTPDFEFAIIAGARGKPEGWNPLIPGDDDGTVSVDCTKLPGAADFMTARALHTVMMFNSRVVDAALRFLETGALRASGVCEPIPSAPLDGDAAEAKIPAGRQGD